MEAELQIFTGQVELKCGSGTSDLHRPGRAEVRKKKIQIFTCSHARQSRSAEAEFKIFKGQVERNCGSGTSNLHMPGRSEVRKRNFRSSQARYS